MIHAFPISSKMIDHNSSFIANSILSIPEKTAKTALPVITFLGSIIYGTSVVVHMAAAKLGTTSTELFAQTGWGIAFIILNFLFIAKHAVSVTQDYMMSSSLHLSSIIKLSESDHSQNKEIICDKIETDPIFQQSNSHHSMNDRKTIIYKKMLEKLQSDYMEEKPFEKTANGWIDYGKQRWNGKTSLSFCEYTKEWFAAKIESLSSGLIENRTTTEFGADLREAAPKILKQLESTDPKIQEKGRANAEKLFKELDEVSTKVKRMRMVSIALHATAIALVIIGLVFFPYGVLGAGFALMGVTLGSTIGIAITEACMNKFYLDNPRFKLNEDEEKESIIYLDPQKPQTELGQPFPIQFWNRT